MSKTRFRKDLAFAGTVSAQSTMYVASLAAVTTFTPPAQSITLGTASNADVTSKLKGVYLSYAFVTAAVSVARTHGLGGVIKAWWPTNQTASFAIWCSNIAVSTTTLTLKAGGSGTVKIFCTT